MQRKLMGAFALFLALIVLDSVLTFVQHYWQFGDRQLPGYLSHDFVSPSLWMIIFQPVLLTVALMVIVRALEVANRSDHAPAGISSAVFSFSCGLGGLAGSSLVNLLLDYPSWFSFDLSWLGALVGFGLSSLGVAFCVAATLMSQYVLSDYGWAIQCEAGDPEKMTRSNTFVVILPTIALWLALTGTLVFYCLFGSFNWLATVSVYAVSAALLWVAQRHYLATHEALARARKAVDARIAEREERERLAKASNDVDNADAKPEPDRELSIRELTSKWLGLNGETEDNPGDTKRLMKRWADIWPGLLFAVAIISFILLRDGFNERLWELTYKLQVADGVNLLQVPERDWWFDVGLPQLALLPITAAMSWVTFKRWMFGKASEPYGEVAELQTAGGSAKQE